MSKFGMMHGEHMFLHQYDCATCKKIDDLKNVFKKMKLYTDRLAILDNILMLEKREPYAGAI